MKPPRRAVWAAAERINFGVEIAGPGLPPRRGAKAGRFITYYLGVVAGAMLLMTVADALLSTCGTIKAFEELAAGAVGGGVFAGGAEIVGCSP